MADDKDIVVGSVVKILFDLKSHKNGEFVEIVEIIRSKDEVRYMTTKIIESNIKSNRDGWLNRDHFELISLPNEEFKKLFTTKIKLIPDGQT